MARRLGKRSLIFLATMFAASVVVFGLLAVVPGDPAQVALGVNSTPEALAQMRAQLGTDRPLIAQYLSWVGGMLHGDFGTSYITRQPVGPQIFQHVQVTMWLVIGGMLVAVLVATPLGVTAALLRGKVRGTFLSGAVVVAIAIPSFILAIMFIAIFAVRLRWLPSGGWAVPTEDPLLFAKSIAMPVLTIGLIQAALLSRYVRSATLEVLNQDYLRTARAKGLTLNAAFARHGLRNTLVPVLTVVGLQITALLVDTIIIEKVFFIPGLGDLLLNGATNRDPLMVQGIVMFIVAVVLVVNFVVDLLYTVVDPRLRTGR